MANPVATQNIRVLLLLTCWVGTILSLFSLASRVPKIDRSSSLASRPSPRSQPFPSRSRLYGLPLADRHAALNAACSLRHRLPRRALVNFYSQLILGKDVAQLKVTKLSLIHI